MAGKAKKESIRQEKRVRKAVWAQEGKIPSRGFYSKDDRRYSLGKYDESVDL
jgi:hypothetical protein